MKARYLTLLTVLLCCSACGAPSLRHKKEINKLLVSAQYPAAIEKIEKAKDKEYTQKDALLYYLDSGTLLHDNAQYLSSDERFALAQDKIDELFTQSVSRHLGQYLVNDLTVPYYPAFFERGFTYYYRAMNFLQRGDINGALVEANKAVYYLDGQRGRKDFQENPFLQYFSSLIFESAGKRDDARISRTRALQAYGVENAGGGLAQGSVFGNYVPNWGEVVLVHANGLLPLKKSESFQLGWGEVLLWSSTSSENTADSLSPEAQNAIRAGLLGSSVTVSYPVLEDQPYSIKNSEVLTQDGKIYPTLLMADISKQAKQELKNKQSATLLRMAIRAAAKRTAAVQARHAMTSASSDESLGQLAEMFVSFLGAITEKADTRQWFTLPAQLRMSRFYVAPGRQDILLRFKDGFGNIVGEYRFEDVDVKPNSRIYLHYRTAK
ncbi:MAG: hypothetical protein IJ311_02275 [Elusimicrobiaceae bacterium]|nr:hypothetical protein [Elusimicrobiaceae bacterium]